MGPSQHFDAFDRLLVCLLVDLWLMHFPPSCSHCYMSVLIIFPVMKTIWSTSSFQRQRCPGKLQLVRRDERTFYEGAGEVTYFCRNALLNSLMGEMNIRVSKTHL